MSHPARGAWIETEVDGVYWEIDMAVAPRPGCVD